MCPSQRTPQSRTPYSRAGAPGELCTASSSGSSPAGYPAPSDITLVVIPEMADMHNFAGTRGQLWDRFYAWLAILARLPAMAYPR